MRRTRWDGDTVTPGLVSLKVRLLSIGRGTLGSTCERVLL